MQAEEVSIIEQGALAHRNLEDIISAQYNVVANYFIIAKGLTECQEMSWWKVLGDDSFNAFLGRPELGFKRSWAYELIKIYKLYVQRLGVSAEDFIHIGPTKLLKMASVVEQDKERWLGDAKALSVSDLDIEIQGAASGVKLSPPTSVPSPPTRMTPDQYIGLVKSSPCLNCGATNTVVPAHFPRTRVRCEHPWHVVPLCYKCHLEQEGSSEWCWTYRANWAKWFYGLIAGE